MKIKIIELLKRVADKNNMPDKIKYKDVIYDLEEYIDYEIIELFGYIVRGDDFLFQHLNDEVEILDEKTEEIEEIKVDRNNFIHTELGSFKGRKIDIAFVNKFNELTKIVNKQNKQDTSKETNCMTD